jgi:hypothetical protein
MDTGTVTAIREARQQLRARGEPDSMHRVVALVQCSQSTVRKYWSRTEPDAPSVDTGPSAPAPVPGTVSIPAAREADCRTAFAAYVHAATRFQAVQGVEGAPADPVHGRPAVPARYALPRSDPWYASLRQELHRTYTAFMDARAAWREDPTAAAHLEQVRQELTSLRQELAVADRQMDEATRTMHRLARDPPLARRPTSPPDTQPLRLAQARHGAAVARQLEIGKAITRLEAQVTRWSTHREEGSSP